MLNRVQMAATAAGLIVLAAGCGGSSSGSPASVAGKGQVVRVGDTSNGKTIDVHVGDTVVLTLHSTYWQIAPPRGAAVDVSVQPSAAAGAGCGKTVPGSGCGTMTASYRVTAAGQGELSASRTSCGEAMRCTGKQGSWSVKLVAT